VESSHWDGICISDHLTLCHAPIIFWCENNSVWYSICSPSGIPGTPVEWIHEDPIGTYVGIGLPQEIICDEDENNNSIGVTWIMTHAPPIFPSAYVPSDTMLLRTAILQINPTTPTTTTTLVTLNSPKNGAVMAPSGLSMSFTFTPICYGDTITGASLWTNEGGSWHLTASNATTVQNNTQNTITHAFTARGSYTWNIRVANSSSYAFASANFTVTVLNGLSVSISSPTNQTVLAQPSLSVSFMFTPVSYGDAITEASLWTNESGSWHSTASNSTTVQNNTQNTITRTCKEGTLLWAIEILNSTTGLFSSNYTLSIAQLYEMSFNWTDLNGASVSGLTYVLRNGTQDMHYNQGDYSLRNGTYALDTYYGSALLNTTMLPISSFGNTTVTLKLNMVPQTFGFIAFNNSVTGLNVTSSSSISLTFTANGTAGPYNITIGVPQLPTYIQKDGVTLTFGTDWTYNDTYKTVTITTPNLSSWILMYATIVVPPPPPITYYSLTTSSTPGGTITPLGTYSYESGSPVTLTASASPGYVFVKWTIDGIDYSSATENITMSQDHTANAVFAPMPPPSTTLYIIIAVSIMFIVIAFLVINRRRH
jgi:hypothetical protein